MCENLSFFKPPIPLSNFTLIPVTSITIKKSGHDHFAKKNTRPRTINIANLGEKKSGLP